LRDKVGRFIDNHRASPDEIGDLTKMLTVDGATYRLEAHSPVLPARDRWPSILGTGCDSNSPFLVEGAKRFDRSEELFYWQG
jgi:NAD-dependent oxidoreductase involved in siderophore biosynthesis